MITTKPEYQIRKVDGKIVYPRFYFRWRAMKYRCHNPKSEEYSRYGARGIEVCNSWWSYPPFHRWCERTFEEGKTIDRIDNDKGYSPLNCRWATPAEQQANARITQAKKDAIKYASTFRTKEGFKRTRSKSGRFTGKL